jgi:hypothetical protein
MAAEVEYRCFVGGLAWATDGRSLEQAFSQYGEVLDSKVSSRVVAGLGALKAGSVVVASRSAAFTYGSGFCLLESVC